MKSILSIVCLLVVGAVAVAEDKPKEKKFDASKLVGTWTYTKGVRGGEEVAKERLAGDVVITKETFTIPGGPDAKFIIAYEIDAKGNPVKIDFDIKDGPVKEGKAQGIISIKGDTCTVCYAPAPGERPTKMKSTEKNGAFLFVLKRKKK